MKLVIECPWGPYWNGTTGYANSGSPRWMATGWDLPTSNGSRDFMDVSLFHITSHHKFDWKDKG